MAPTPDNLWTMLQAGMDTTRIHNHTIQNIMTNWMKQQDHPVVRSYRFGNELYVCQDQYYLDDKGNMEQDSPNNWWIPITFTTDEQLDFTNTTPHYWLISQLDKREFFVELQSKDGWVILNLQQTGEHR